MFLWGNGFPLQFPDFCYFTDMADTLTLKDSKTLCNIQMVATPRVETTILCEKIALDFIDRINVNILNFHLPNFL